MLPDLYETKMSTNIDTVRSEIKRFAQKYSTRLQQQTNMDMQQLPEKTTQIRL